MLVNEALACPTHLIHDIVANRQFSASVSNSSCGNEFVAANISTTDIEMRRSKRLECARRSGDCEDQSGKERLECIVESEGDTGEEKLECRVKSVDNTGEEKVECIVKSNDHIAEEKL
ncbi:hypothetical protein FOCC_FOCC006097, partial [Frankliniella occidentalis]